MSSSEDVKFSNVRGLYLRKYGIPYRNTNSKKKETKKKRDTRFRWQLRDPHFFQNCGVVFNIISADFVLISAKTTSILEETVFLKWKDFIQIVNIVCSRVVWLYYTCLTIRNHICRVLRGPSQSLHIGRCIAVCRLPNSLKDLNGIDLPVVSDLRP